ncbi:O-antigen ligase family protein [Halocatena marina]|uniref:O-antigen ligase family protein n=1 Tax=Halocatena marina TaxID=2934937 RepID=A0ABD5YKU4_9EURY|nr:O-antigen ligase family protein [Halocatena marina]
MNLSNPFERFLDAPAPLSNGHSFVILSVVLIFGLTFVAPALSMLTGAPVLFFVVLIGSIYGVLAVWFREPFIGSLIALLVTAMFAADVPLASEAYTSLFRGHLGPRLWLAQLPLIASVGLVLFTKHRALFDGRTRVEELFALFVGWTVLSAVFGATVRVDAALFFSLLMFQGLIVFSLFRYTVQQRILSFRSVVWLFIGTVLAQSAFAVGQFLNQDVFGLSTLGEGDGIALSWITLGPFGQFSFGTHVAGFTGMSFHLASLIVLAVPLTIVLAVRETGRKRGVLLGLTILMIAILRGTTTDAGRGGLIVTLICVCLALVCLYHTSLFDSIVSRSSHAISGRSRLISLGWVVFTVPLSIIALFFPSSTAGNKSAVTEVSSGVGVSGGGGGGGLGGPSRFEAINSSLQSLSIPFFNIANLGIRVQQYVAGVDLFIQNPLFGIGGANFVYYTSEYGFPEPLPLHSMYFAMLAEAGFPGFVLMVVILVSILWYGWKAIPRSSDGALLVGMLCGFIGWLAFAFWSIPTIKLTTMFPFWALAGATVGVYAQDDTA